MTGAKVMVLWCADLGHVGRYGRYGRIVLCPHGETNIFGSRQVAVAGSQFLGDRTGKVTFDLYGLIPGEGTSLDVTS